MLQATDDGATDPVPVFLVASPVPTVGPAEFERRLSFIATHLAKERKRREENTDTKYRYHLPRNVEHFLPYSDAASFGEVYFPGSYPNSYLADAHRRLALSIANLVVGRRERYPSTSASSGRFAVLAEPIHVAIENVHADILNFEPNVLPVTLHPYPAEHEDAPWERLLAQEDRFEALKLISDMPDVVVIPQTHLQALKAKFNGELLHDLNSLRCKVGEDASRALDLEFLDTYYRNWRHWCSTEGTLAGLLFPLTPCCCVLTRKS